MNLDALVQRDTPLARDIRREIAANGPVPVAHFMARCLWDNNSGYYATRDVIGKSGDFITAAEISQVFGELAGVWAGVVWQQILRAPERVSFAEYGPGRGTLMRDALKAVRVVPGFSNAATIHMIEMSERLAASQRAILAAAGFTATWSNNLAGFSAPAIIVANEFLDAWPLEQWVKTAQGWRNRGVATGADGKFYFCALPTCSRLDLDQTQSNAPVGAVVETQRPDRLAAAFAAIAQTGPVVALVIDYGHAGDVSGDTLQAVRDHRYEHPLASPGEADLSAQVNFFELARALDAAGLDIDGPVTQAEFLGALGIVERASRLMHANPARAGEIEAGVARLLAPNGMGTRFKVAGVRSKGLSPLPGFP